VTSIKNKLSMYDFHGLGHVIECGANGLCDVPYNISNGFPLFIPTPIYLHIQIYGNNLVALVVTCQIINMFENFNSIA